MQCEYIGLKESTIPMNLHIKPHFLAKPLCECQQYARLWRHLNSATKPIGSNIETFEAVALRVAVGHGTEEFKHMCTAEFFPFSGQGPQTKFERGSSCGSSLGLLPNTSRQGSHSTKFVRFASQWPRMS